MIKKFKDFIKENAVNNDEYKDDFFDKVQDHMKNILKSRGMKDADKFVTDLITQNQNTIKKIVDKFVVDGAITPDVVAQQLVDKYHDSTIFNNRGNLPEPNKIMGDRSMNSME